MKKLLQWSLVLGLATAGAMLPALAQDYPNRPIKLIVPFSPGAGTDATGRIVADGLSKRLGQPVVVENKPGAGSMIGIEFVLKSPADGYTLLYGTADGLTVLPAVSSEGAVQGSRRRALPDAHVHDAVCDCGQQQPAGQYLG